MIYTLCGSTRFPDAFALANAHLSMMGHVVIGLGLFGHADEPRGARFLTSDGDESTPEKQGLDELHYRKIDLSDGIYVVNVGGYVGSSTKREIAYAEKHGKTVEWMFPTVTVAERYAEQVDDLERVIDVHCEAWARVKPALRNGDDVGEVADYMRRVRVLDDLAVEETCDDCGDTVEDGVKFCASCQQDHEDPEIGDYGVVQPGTAPIPIETHQSGSDDA